MNSFRFFFLLFFTFVNFMGNAQKKTLQAKYTKENITIDGKINEDDWASAPIATDFVMFEPDNGKAISDNKKTDVKILYDNNAIYISAVLKDEEPNKISRELTNRDEFGFSDVFSVFINGNNDGQQDFRFFVSAAGVQMDCLATEFAEDFSWDGIWDSAVKITDTGWVVEMKIPYAALRFSQSPKQTWGLNFKRNILRGAIDQSYTWNFVDTKIGAVIFQAGLLEGIENIKTPTRLFFIPYTSAYYQQNDFLSDRTLKAGLDIKYGINDAFTLDAILVPDFGQTKFDNAILNLEPFEQQFDENRSFFTEATDLFSKGNLFYSRRIGGEPTSEPIVNDNEVPTQLPNSTDLLNAVKVSGRTEKGLGIGFLNAVTEKTYATIENIDNGETRKEVVEPLVNYNILVLDHRFNQNSSVTFLNLNTLRNGIFRDANVSGLLFDLNTKENTFKLSGDFKYSTIHDNNLYSLLSNGLENYDGFKTQVSFAKTSGKYRYSFFGKYLSKHYDANDLGILFVNNYSAAYAEMTYRIINPTKTFNTFKFNQNINVELHNTTGKIQEAWYKAVMTALTVKNHYIEGLFEANAVDRFDFYEPRTYGRYVFVPKSAIVYGQFYSNDNRPFHYEIEGSIEKFDEDNRNVYRLFGGLKYRFSDRFSLAYNIQYTRKTNDRGWVDFQGDDIVFGERNREIVDHYFTGKYSLTNKMSINLTARYYWSYADYHEFFTLQNDGYLVSNPTYTANRNRNFNSWNFDLSYSWWFAPASEISVLYRNFASESTNDVEKNVQTNFNNVLNNNLTSTFSISLRYYIDYNSLKRNR